MKRLFIPEDIKLEREYLPGMGLKELKQGLLFAVPGILIMIILLCVLEGPGPKLLSMIGGIIWLICCYAVVAKDEDVGSMYSYFSGILQYYRTQQRFPYKQEMEVLRYAQENGSEGIDRT